MAARNRTKIEANFRPAKEAGHEVVMAAIKVAIEAGHQVSQKKLDSQAGRRGYNLDGGLVLKEAGGKTGNLWAGAIYTEEWWARFFEYGTVHIEAMPFIRPGYRKGRKVLLAELEGNFEKWVRKRARVRRAR